jgi:hypothetical protein
MLYIHRTACISPQLSFGHVNLDKLMPSVNNRLVAIEPTYNGIPQGQLRRMSKGVRMGIGASLSVTAGSPAPAGIIIGTGNGGMEDSIEFLNQLVAYDEGMLTPGHFVQSTANAVASQISMASQNHGYNCTHVHRGLAFENALQDAILYAGENRGRTVLLGAVDEISEHHYNIERLEGSYREGPVSNSNLYANLSPGTIAGEGAVIFMVNGLPDNALARIDALYMMHSPDPGRLQNLVAEILQSPAGRETDLVISGENGDQRLEELNQIFFSELPEGMPIARYKHMCGDYPTASAMGCWLACQILMTQRVPAHMFRCASKNRQSYRKVLLYNGYKGKQHSLILISAL